MRQPIAVRANDNNTPTAGAVQAGRHLITWIMALSGFRGKSVAATE